jgi:hypothetical protein
MPEDTTRPRGAHRAPNRVPRWLTRAAEYAVVWIVLVWLAAACCWGLAQQLMGIR